jgi:hypothetical protein
MFMKGSESTVESGALCGSVGETGRLALGDRGEMTFSFCAGGEKSRLLPPVLDTYR